MGTINITQYDQTPGAMGDANALNSAFSTIQTAFNGNIEDVNIKAAAAIAASKIALDTDGTLAANSNTVIASQKAVKAYADAITAGLGTRTITSMVSTSNVTCSEADTSASPKTLLTLPSAAYLAARVRFEITAQYIVATNSNAGSTLNLALYDGTGYVGAILQMTSNVANSALVIPCSIAYEYTPAAGTRVYSVVGYFAGGGTSVGVIRGGAGGAIGTPVPINVSARYV